MSEKKYFGTDGIRGITSSESRYGELIITPEFCIRLGRAASRAFPGHDFILGCDTRRSSEMIAGALSSGIAAEGAKVSKVGVIPTPGVAYLAKKHSCIGVMVTASHNPAEYNGIKFFTSDGEKLSDSEEIRLEGMLGEDAEPSVRGSEKVVSASEMGEEYLDMLYDTARAFLPIGEKLPEIALDTANGAAYLYARRLFMRLGAMPRLIGSLPNGDNINLDCGATHTETLSKAVTKDRLDFGLALDGDGDRCIAIDEKGEKVDGDQILAICSDALLRWGMYEPLTAVGTLMSNRGLYAFLRSRNISMYTADVGDKYVRLEMLAHDSPIGGEDSGHIIFRDLSTTGDGLITSIMLCAAYLDGDCTFSELCPGFEKYPAVTLNCSVSTEAKERFKRGPDEELTKEIKDAEERLGETGKVLVRASGTEPFIRVTVESPDRERAELAANRLAFLINKIYCAIPCDGDKEDICAE